MKNLDVPTVISSGQAVDMDLDMSVTLIGDIGLLQATGSDVNVNMTFWLLESIDDLEKSRVCNNSEMNIWYFLCEMKYKLKRNETISRRSFCLSLLQNGTLTLV